MALSWVVQTGRLRHRNCPKVGTERTANGGTIAQWNVSLDSVLRCIRDVSFTLEQVMKVQKGVEVQLYSFFNLGTISGWVVKVIP
jgi:hypothetical protein